MKRKFTIITSCFLLSGCAGIQHINADSKSIRFQLFRPAASEVQLLYSTNHFIPVPMTKKSFGVWETTIPMTTSEFSYFYCIDDIPYTPDCPVKEQDDFGSDNCIFLPGKQQ